MVLYKYLRMKEIPKETDEIPGGLGGNVVEIYGVTNDVEYWNHRNIIYVLTVCYKYQNIAHQSIDLSASESILKIGLKFRSNIDLRVKNRAK